MERVTRNSPAFMFGSVRFERWVPYAAVIRDDIMLMDDNCKPHRANLVDDFLFEERIANGMASVFTGHESNRASLGHSRQRSCWSPTLS
ncbi:hypothetical protein TNCV_2851351 [Trichonephila clavipes]|nr:hypothetical protein TNCV_2851351 [Trichonephila clavipes]